MKPDQQTSCYRVYVLRSWMEDVSSPEAPAVWRFSLEDPATRQRRGFANLESLMRFLAGETPGSRATGTRNDDP